AGAQPAGTAPAGAAQAGGQQGAGSPSASAATQAKPGTTIQGAGAGAKPGASTAPVRSGAGGGGAKVLPARPAPTQRPRPIPSPATAGSQTAVIPPPGRRGRNWTAPRYLALIVAGVIVLGLGGVVGFLALTDSDGGAKKSSPSVSLPNGSGATKKKSSHKKRNFPPAIDPATVTVAVLNGTQVTGLASSTGQKVSAAGFRLGNVATASQQTPRTESVVLYQPGQSRQARAVARKLDISQIEPVDSSSAALAGAANVVVVVGADKANTQ
ncbi:MAG: LytR cell envelope-related transcriptional attenuator, partial [Thermoleophilaceae bacterium]|nr:LytR cell envelope-related transcriptional attenuator [Thermoleophilaceae bacterium]